MKWINKIKKLLNENRLYLYGLLFVTFVTVFAMGLFFNNSVNMQEGWYTIYARFVLNGLLPYKDFFYLMPPLFLYFWTGIQAVFGDSFIVFHIADIFLKLSVGLLFYHLMTKFFPVKISALCAAFSQVIFISIVYDNGVISYNSLRIVFMLVMALIMIAQTDYIKKFNKTDTKLFVLLGITYTLAFLTKQTDGPINIIASVGVMLLIIYKKFGLKSTIKPFFIMFGASMASLVLLSAPLIFGGAVPDFISNVFLSYGAKGNLSDIFNRLSTVMFTYDFSYPVFLSLVIIFCFWAVAMERKPTLKLSFKIDRKNTRKFLLISAALFLFSFAAAYALVKIMHSYRPYKLTLNTFITAQNQIVVVCLFLLFFLALYQTIKIFINKKFIYTNSKLLIVAAMLLSSFITHTLSYGPPSGYFYIAGFTAAILLGIKVYGNKLKNILIYTVILSASFICFTIKIQAPSIFHGWYTSPLVEEGFDYTFVPKLKGIKLAHDERKMFEDFYNQSNRYTQNGDRILAFNNNQAFYDILERTPYNQYISLYHDVSPDEQAFKTIEQLQTDLPKEIAFLKFSEWSEKLHEDIFRSGQKSGQRALSAFIQQLIDENKYTIVISYERGIYIDEKELNKKYPGVYNRYMELLSLEEDLKNKLYYSSFPHKDTAAELEQVIEEKEKLRRKVKYSIKVRNPFLEPGFKLMLLVRTDIYNKVNKNDRKN